MKKIAAINFLIVLALLAGSCATNNNVVSNRLITKRKHTKGFYINKKDRTKSDSGEQVAQVEEKSERMSYAEKLAARKAAKSASNEARNEEVYASVQERTESPNNYTGPSNALSDEEPNGDFTEEMEESAVDSDENEKAPSEPLAPSRKELTKEVRKEARMQKRQMSNGNSADDMFILAVIFAILIPPLGVGIYTNIDWMKVLICLLLCILFWLPGMIYALLVVFDVI